MVKTILFVGFHPSFSRHGITRSSSVLRMVVESVVFLVLVVTLVFPWQQVVVNHRKLYLLFRFLGMLPPSKC